MRQKSLVEASFSLFLDSFFVFKDLNATENAFLWNSEPKADHPERNAVKTKDIFEVRLPCSGRIVSSCEGLRTPLQMV